MREIPIKNRKNLKILVDDEDYEVVNKYIWYANSKNSVNAFGGQGIFIHLLHLIVDKTKMWDHRDRNKLNFQKDNLRPTTLQLNMANTAKFKHKTSSKYKGVSYCQRDQVWRAYIKLNGKSRSLGTFRTEESAALAYNSEARIHFKEFAVLNIITKEEKSRG